MQSTGLALSHTLISKQLKSNQSTQEVAFGMPGKIGQVTKSNNAPLYRATLASAEGWATQKNNTQKSVITAISYAIRLELSEYEDSSSKNGAPGEINGGLACLFGPSRGLSRDRARP